MASVFVLCASTATLFTAFVCIIIVAVVAALSNCKIITAMFFGTI